MHCLRTVGGCFLIACPRGWAPRAIERSGLLALLLCLLSGPAWGGLRAFEFGGVVTLPGAPYGVAVPAGSTVRGRFVYATGVTATHNLEEDSRFFLQEFPGGFRMELGDLLIVADSYLAGVTLGFDTDDDGEANADFFSILFDRSFPAPKVSFPLFVADVPRQSGAFSLSWAFQLGTFASAELPEVLPGEDFVSTFNSFLTSSPGIPSVLFDITSLGSIPLVTGDYDFDGQVTLADHGIWVSEFGDSGPSLADANGDGAVDAADYTVWRDRLSGAAQQSAGSGGSVPEPPTLLLAAWLAAAVAPARNLGRAFWEDVNKTILPRSRSR